MALFRLNVLYIVYLRGVCDLTSLSYISRLHINELYRLHPIVYKILDIYNRQYNTLFMYNLLMFINIATCFDHNFDHHQALNEHISSNQTHWMQYRSVLVDGLLSTEYVKGIYYKVTIMIKKMQKISLIILWHVSVLCHFISCILYII
jgi:hypothetical protein